MKRATKGAASVPAGRADVAARSVLDTVDLAHWRAAREAGVWQPIERGEAWPDGVGPVAFERHTVAVPPEWPLEHVRLVLLPGGPGRALVHSKHGLASFDLAEDGGEVPVNALAFGLRLEASEIPGEPPRFGGARLERLDPDAASVGRAGAIRP